MSISDIIDASQCPWLLLFVDVIAVAVIVYPVAVIVMVVVEPLAPNI